MPVKKDPCLDPVRSRVDWVEGDGTLDRRLGLALSLYLAEHDGGVEEGMGVRSSELQ